MTERRRRVDVAWWRRWHRWIGFPAAVFLLFAATTGFLVAFAEFFGPEEALRERTRDLVSPVRVNSAPNDWSGPVARAIKTASDSFPGAPIDKIEVRFKGDLPTVTLFTGKPTGGEDRKLVFDARTGRLLSNETYADKPLLYRIHSGEAFGDGGLVLAMGWALALVTLTISGFIIYLTMRRANAKGLQRIFW